MPRPNQFARHRRYAEQVVAAGTQNYDDLIAPTSTSYTVYITKITLSITTHAAQTLTVQDNNTSAKPIAAHTDAAAGAGVLSVVTWDFGEKGVALTEGKNLDIRQSAAGIAGILYVEGYELETS